MPRTLQSAQRAEFPIRADGHRRCDARCRHPGPAILAGRLAHVDVRVIVTFEGIWAVCGGTVRRMFWGWRVLWKGRGALAGRPGRLCEKVHVANRQHAKCLACKLIRRSAEMALPKRNMAGPAITSGCDTTCEERRRRGRIPCCGSSTWAPGGWRLRSLAWAGAGQGEGRTGGNPGGGRLALFSLTPALSQGRGSRGGARSGGRANTRFAPTGRVG